MKRLLISAIFILPLLAGCKSVPTDLNNYAPVALMTVYSNPAVPWYDQATDSESVDDGVISGALNRMLNKANPENEGAQERIDYASAFFSSRLKDFNIQVIDPTTNPQATAYKGSNSEMANYISNTVPAKGYQAFTTSKGKRNKTLCQETGAKSVLYVNFRFQKMYLKKGVRNKGVGARVVMHVFGTDEKGKMIINKEYTAVSDDYAELIKSTDWDKEKVVSFFPDLENKVITQFLADFAFGGDAVAASEVQATPIKLPVKAPVSETESAVLQEKRETAQKLLEKGMTAAETAEITGLTVEEVESLK